MSRTRCPECDGHLTILGMNDYEDGIIVECDECGEELELESDGLGDAGMEMLEAHELGVYE